MFALFYFCMEKVFYLCEFFQSLLEDFLVLHAGEFLGHFAAFEDLEGRDGHDSEFGSRVAVLVDVQLADLGFAFHFLGQFLDDRSHHLARSAPGRPKINQCRLLALQNLLLKIFVGEFHFHTV